MMRLSLIPRPQRPAPQDIAANASPEAIVRAFAIRVAREWPDDASRLIDCAVAQVQAELRGQTQ